MTDAVDEAAFKTWCPTSQYRLPFWCPSTMVLSKCLKAKPVLSKATVAPFRVRALVDRICKCILGTCNTSERIKSYPLFVLMVTLPTLALLIIELLPRDI